MRRGWASSSTRRWPRARSTSPARRVTFGAMTARSRTGSGGNEVGMATIETIVRSINRDLAPQFEERLRAALAEQDREWLIDQIVRLTLDAHSLREIDARGVVAAKARARRERQARVRKLAFDHAALQAFVAQHAGARREGPTPHGHRQPH